MRIVVCSSPAGPFFSGYEHCGASTGAACLQQERLSGNTGRGMADTFPGYIQAPLADPVSITVKELPGNIPFRTCYVDSPFGCMLTAALGGAVCFIGFASQKRSLQGAFAESRIIQSCHDRKSCYSEELEEHVSSWFNPEGPRHAAVPVLLVGTSFQCEVWRALCTIPAGATVTYAGLSRRIGRTGAARAVGSALAANPVAWVIPCHRVVPAANGPGGYRWGVECKTNMIKAEAVYGDR